MKRDTQIDFERRAVLRSLLVVTRTNVYCGIFTKMNNHSYTIVSQRLHDLIRRFYIVKTQSRNGANGNFIFILDLFRFFGQQIKIISVPHLIARSMTSPKFAAKIKSS